jgi:hypothetical protein
VHIEAQRRPSLACKDRLQFRVANFPKERKSGEGTLSLTFIELPVAIILWVQGVTMKSEHDEKLCQSLAAVPL